jgi:hypothetical protein
MHDASVIGRPIAFDLNTIMTIEGKPYWGLAEKRDVIAAPH